MLTVEIARAKWRCRAKQTFSSAFRDIMVTVHNDIFTRNSVNTAVYQILKQQPKAFNNTGNQEVSSNI